MPNKMCSAFRPTLRPGAVLPILAAATLICTGATRAAHGQVTETVLHNFSGGEDGSLPGGLLADSSGKSGALRALYGVTGESGDGVVYKLIPPSKGGSNWNDRVLYSSSTGTPGSLFSESTRVTGKTPIYVTGGAISGGYGTVYTLTGKKTAIIWKFTGGKDGAGPSGPVIADTTGSLYLSANSGGKSGCGTVVKLTPPANGQTKWTETTLVTFSGKNGCNPDSSVIAGPAGVLYGTTAFGGSSNNGTAFMLSPPAQGQTAWTEQILHSFAGGKDGEIPFAGLVAGPGGVLYGATELGGGNTDCVGNRSCGVVFELTPPADGQTTWTEQVIWAFSGADGDNPDNTLIVDKTGTVFGVTFDGGGTSQGGAAFKLTPPAQGQTVWTETTLWVFDSAGGIDGEAAGPLVADGSGILYGTTIFGGSAGDGVAYSLTGTGFVP